MCSATVDSVLHRTVDRIVLDAITRRVFPGAVVLIAHGTRVDLIRAYGSTMYDAPDSRPVAPNTIYDIASLTKIVTATAALLLHQRGLLELDIPAATYLPELCTRTVTVRHLLTHTSGLDLRLSTAARNGAQALRDAIFSAPLRQDPGSVVAYTNINSLLLGEIVARQWGGPLENALDDLICIPLGMHETCFRPPEGLRGRIAPTEIDEQWRGDLIHGVVHDESAFALGGVAGHAGLFSTAADLHRFGVAWLPTGSDGPQQAEFLHPETIAEASRNQTSGLGQACGLGWMIDRRNFMGDAPPGTIGHTGFTGPAIVVIPAQRLLVVVLSNRVYPQRGEPAHHRVTEAIVRTALFHSSCH